MLSLIQEAAGASGDVIATLRLDLLAKLLLAVLLGGAIGLERELSGKPAGLRTNILICVGSALLMDLSVRVAFTDGVLDGERIGDPARIAAQVVSGIGFLGAGTILQARGAVIGLTTAATIWTVAAIGLTVGAGLYVEASGAAILVTGVLAGLGSIEKRLLSARRVVSGTLRVRKGTSWEELAADLTAAGLHVQSKTVYEHPEDTAYELKLVGPLRQYDVATTVLIRRNDVISVQFD